MVFIDNIKKIRKSYALLLAILFEKNLIVRHLCFFNCTQSHIAAKFLKFGTSANELSAQEGGRTYDSPDHKAYDSCPRVPCDEQPHEH